MIGRILRVARFCFEDASEWLNEWMSVPRDGLFVFRCVIRQRQHEAVFEGLPG